MLLVPGEHDILVQVLIETNPAERLKINISHIAQVGDC